MSQARREVPTEGAFGAAIESQGKRKCSERASDTVTLCEPEPDTPPRSPRRRQHTHPQPTTGRARPGDPEGGRAGTPLPAGGGGGGRPGPATRVPVALTVCSDHRAVLLPASSIAHLQPEAVGGRVSRRIPWGSTRSPCGSPWGGRRRQATWGPIGMKDTLPQAPLLTL